MMMMAVGYLSAVCCFLVLAVMELKLGPKSAVKIVSFAEFSINYELFQVCLPLLDQLRHVIFSGLPLPAEDQNQAGLGDPVLHC